jgi:methenyltetrahydromethanopterin cyclohydrolase
MDSLNSRAAALFETLVREAGTWRVAVERCPSGAMLVDCGRSAPGGLEAGRRLAEICLAGRAVVELRDGPESVWPGPWVAVRSDDPVAACLGAQYAGWQLQAGDYFAMGSGPMRALARKEKLIQQLALDETSDRAVGVLETRKRPPEELCRKIATDCGVDPARLSLLWAPTASLAGAVQIVARSLETALHKLHELGFDLATIVSGCGSAPLPPVADETAGDLVKSGAAPATMLEGAPADRTITALGRTNDAILYGAEVTLWVRCADEAIRRAGPATPSLASAEHGAPFAEIFERAGRDFYKIDPGLFSPAVIRFHNLATGRMHSFGATAPAVLQRSFREP